MGTVYPRGSIWWLGFVGRDGRWHYKSARTTNEQSARELLAVIEDEIKKGVRLENLGPLSVAEWGERWQESRLKRQPPVWNAKSEWAQVETHAMNVLIEGKRFGRMRMLDVRPRHALMLVRGIREGKNTHGETLAPRTVANVWGTVHKMFSDAVLEEVIMGNPMVLPDTEHPRRVDADPTWRRKAIYSRPEAEKLLCSSELEEHRRVLYALALLGGLRAGEVADRRWADYDADAEPLGRLSVHSSYTRKNKQAKGTKSEQPREVPVHPFLASILAQWKLSGWEKAHGRKPTPEDFICLNTRQNQVDDQYILDGLRRDLENLGLRKRRYHDMRRTFISLTLGDGANREALKCVTHGMPGDIMGQYTTFDWEALCSAVSKLRLGRFTTVVTTKGAI